jgi:hypothetical protein
MSFSIFSFNLVYKTFEASTFTIKLTAHGGGINDKSLLALGRDSDMRYAQNNQKNVIEFDFEAEKFEFETG